MAETDTDNDAEDPLAAFDPRAELVRRLASRRQRPGMVDLDAARPPERAPGLGLAQSPLSRELGARAHSHSVDTLAVAPGELVLASAGNGLSAEPVADGAPTAAGGQTASPLAVAAGHYASDSMGEATLLANLVQARAEVASLQVSAHLVAQKREIAAKKSPPKSWQSRHEDDTLPGIGAALFGSFGQPTLPTQMSALLGSEAKPDDTMPLVHAAASAEPSQVTWSDEDPSASPGAKTTTGAVARAAAQGRAPGVAKAAAAGAGMPAPQAGAPAESAPVGPAEGSSAELGAAQGGGDTRRVAEAVSRSLYRQLQLERERQGISPWKS